MNTVRRQSREIVRLNNRIDDWHMISVLVAGVFFIASIWRAQ